MQSQVEKFKTDPVRLQYIQAMEKILDTAPIVTIKTQTHLYSELAPMYKKKYLQLLDKLKEYQARQYSEIHKHLPKEKYLPEDKSRTILKYYKPEIG